MFTKSHIILKEKTVFSRRKIPFWLIAKVRQTVLNHLKLQSWKEMVALPKQPPLESGTGWETVPDHSFTVSNSVIAKRLSNLKSIDQSSLLPWQKVNALNTFVVTQFSTAYKCHVWLRVSLIALIVQFATLWRSGLECKIRRTMHYAIWEDVNVMVSSCPLLPEMRLKSYQCQSRYSLVKISLCALWLYILSIGLIRRWGNTQQLKYQWSSFWTQAHIIKRYHISSALLINQPSIYLVRKKAWQLDAKELIVRLC